MHEERRSRLSGVVAWRSATGGEHGPLRVLPGGCMELIRGGEPAGQLRLHVRLLPGARGDVQAQAPVERQGGGQVGGDDADEIELRCHARRLSGCRVPVLNGSDARAAGVTGTAHRNTRQSFPPGGTG